MNANFKYFVNCKMSKKRLLLNDNVIQTVTIVSALNLKTDFQYIQDAGKLLLKNRRVAWGCSNKSFEIGNHWSPKRR